MADRGRGPCVICGRPIPPPPARGTAAITCSTECAHERDKERSGSYFARNADLVRSRNREWHRAERERIRAARPRRTCKTCGVVYAQDGRQSEDYCSKPCAIGVRTNARAARKRAARRAEAAEREIDATEEALKRIEGGPDGGS